MFNPNEPLAGSAVARDRRLGGAAVLDGDDHDTFVGLQVEVDDQKPRPGADEEAQRSFSERADLRADAGEALEGLG